MSDSAEMSDDSGAPVGSGMLDVVTGSDVLEAMRADILGTIISDSGKFTDSMDLEVEVSSASGMIDADAVSKDGVRVSDAEGINGEDRDGINAGLDVVDIAE